MAGITYPDYRTETEAFFARCGLSPSTRQACHRFAAARFPGIHIQPAPSQGYCSYTLLVGDDLVVQFRPPRHQLDLSVTSLARSVFGDVAPHTEFLGTVTGVPVGLPGPAGPRPGPGRSESASGSPVLHAYSVGRIHGTSLVEYRRRKRRDSHDHNREVLMRSFARLWALSWARAETVGSRFEKGLVGSTLKSRLEAMMALPGEFRGVVKSALLDLEAIMALPWVLSHGDLVAANIMVDSGTGRLAGLIDWAEAEWLPFGIGLYGLEELLGEDIPGLGFRYYPDANRLRDVFWTELFTAIPDLRCKASASLLRSAQVVGILLWHGIAFDDGLLDRVVREGRDDGEIQRLRVFLLRPLHLSHADDGRMRWCWDGVQTRVRSVFRGLFARQCVD